MKHIFVTNVVCRASANLLRTITFLALIIMSPIMNADEVDASTLQKSQKESIQKDQRKVVLGVNYHKAQQNNDKTLDADIYFISTDDDDETLEIVALQIVEKDVPYYGSIFDIGKDPLGSYQIINALSEIKGLKICNVYSDEDLSDFEYKRYYVTGIGFTRSSEVKDAHGKILRNSKTRPSTHHEIEITEEFYEYLKDTLEDEVTYEEEDVVDLELKIWNAWFGL